MADERFEKIQEDNKLDKVLEGLNIDENHILDSQQLQQLKDLLRKYKDIFSTGDTAAGLCYLIKQRIDLLDNTPFKQRQRRIPLL